MLLNFANSSQKHTPRLFETNTYAQLTTSRFIMFVAYLVKISNDFYDIQSNMVST